MSKLLVIGHSVLDRIYYKNQLSEKPGGIFHAINTLVNIVDADSEIYLATHFSDESFSHFSVAYNSVNLEFSETKKIIPTVTLNLFDGKEREEQYSNTAEAIKLPDKIYKNNFDLILVNMVSGFDISIDDLSKLKKNVGCEIYFDIHTLSRGFDKNGNRAFRKIPKIEEYLKSIDILQMNENEMKTLWGINSEEENIQKLMELGITKVIITKGNKGVSVYNNTEKFNIAPIKVNSINFVGCGDSFGAAFCYKYMKNKNLISASVFANFVAGKVTTFQSISDYKKLKSEIKKYD